MARFLSWLLHPLWLPTYLLITILLAAHFTVYSLFSPKIAMLWGGVFLLTALLPALGTYFLVRTGRAANMFLPNRSDRFFAYWITFICQATLGYQLAGNASLKGYGILLLAIAFSVLITLLINNWFKISAHTTGMGGMIAVLICSKYALSVNLQAFIPIALVVAGLIGWARLTLLAHTEKEVWLGYASGFLSILLGVPLLLLVFN